MISGGVRSFVFSTKSAICSGVVPQHPPRTEAPASTSSGPKDANSSGPILYTVSPSMISGRPAFGFARSGTFAYTFILRMISAISCGPVEQLTPTTSAPMLCNTTMAVSGSVPYSVLPSSLKLMDAMIGRSQVARIAKMAALVSARLIIVSTTNKSTPASHRIFTCSL